MYPEVLNDGIITENKKLIEVKILEYKLVL
jgi:hypothetical protein